MVAVVETMVSRVVGSVVVASKPSVMVDGMSMSEVAASPSVVV